MILINYKGHGYVFQSVLHPAQEDTLGLGIEESREESVWNEHEKPWL